MFYSQFILAKKGPLGTIWIAAHLERKLRKNQVTETNISVSVDSILFPEVPIALRLSGHLLLGVVRIYSRKVNYLFHDCSEALTKIKQAFHSGAVDLPPDAATAPFHSITIPENFDLDELEPLPERESNALFTSSADHHVTSREQITLRDPLGDDVYLASFDMDERFPEGDADKLGIDFEEELLDKTYERERSPVITLEEDQLAPMPEDEELDFDRMDVDANEDVPASPVVVQGREDEDELFGHSIEMQPMLDDERLEPASLAADDDMDFEQQHHCPHTPPVLSEVGGAELAVAQDGEEGLRNPSGLPDQEMSSHGKTLNLTDTGEAQDMEDIEHEANKENEDTFGGAISSGAGMEQMDEHGRDEVGIATRDEENVAEEAEDRNPQESVVPVHEEGAEPLHGMSNEVRAANSVDGDHDNEAPETLQDLEQQLHKDDAVSTAQNVQVHDEDGDASIISPKDGQRSPDEVPEYEVVRSAVDTVEKEPDMFEMDKGSPSEMIPEQQHAAENVDEIMEDVLPVANEHDHVLEGAMVVREHSSPHLASPGNEHDVHEDNDVLAELLGGRGTPALGVVPTPLAAIAPKTVKPRVSKKRKAVFDLFDLRTVIQAEAMRDQLVNTADIRRVRKKAPCTRREFWLLQRELQANNGFHDPSVPGLCSELRDLFHRVCIFGGANLPRPGMHDMSLDKEKTLELDLGNEEIENDIYSDGYAPVPTPEENGHESHQEAQKEISPEQPHQTANATDGKDWAESPENDAVMEDQDTMLNETVHNGPMESHRPENEAEVGAAEEVVDEDEAARQAAREAVLLEWEAFDNASLEQESLKQVEQQLEFQLQETEVSTAHADASGPVVQEEDTTKEAEQLLVRSEADIETEPYFPPTQANLETQSHQQDVSQGDLCAEARANEARQEIEHSESVPDIQAGVAASIIQVIGAEVEADTVGDTSIVQETSKIDPQPEISHHEEHDMSDRGHDEGDSLQDVDDHQAQLPEIVGDVSATSPDADATSHEIPPGGNSLENGNPITGDAYMNGAIHASPEELNNREDLGFLADAQETVYRTGDDGDLEMDADEYVDTRDYNQDEPLVQDNSGWSVRTRAVGRYLKATLDAMEMKMNRVEGLPSAPTKLGLERTLVGKSRKEAARMFFETLVLKTKDYIHVEQEEPYEDIKLSAGPKLRKSTF